MKNKKQNVTANDNFFTGHFPDRKIMPGETKRSSEFLGGEREKATQQRRTTTTQQRRTTTTTTTAPPPRSLSDLLPSISQFLKISLLP